MTDYELECESTRAYGFFDALYGRPSVLPDDPACSESYLAGYHSGLERRKEMNAPRSLRDERPPLGPTLSYPRPEIVARKRPRWARREVSDG